MRGERIAVGGKTPYRTQKDLDGRVVEDVKKSPEHNADGGGGGGKRKVLEITKKRKNKESRARSERDLPGLR